MDVQKMTDSMTGSVPAHNVNHVFRSHDKAPTDNLGRKSRVWGVESRLSDWKNTQSILPERSASERVPRVIQISGKCDYMEAYRWYPVHTQ